MIYLLLFLGASISGCGKEPVAQLQSSCEQLCELYEEKAALLKTLVDSDDIRANFSIIESWCDRNDAEKKTCFQCALACRNSHQQEAAEVLKSHAARWEKANVICSTEIQRLLMLFSVTEPGDEEIDHILCTRFGPDTNPFR